MDVASAAKGIQGKDREWEVETAAVATAEARAPVELVARVGQSLQRTSIQFVELGCLM